MVEVMLVVAIIGLLTTIVLAVRHKEKVAMPAAYAAWVKHTGNPNELAYDEWRSLMNAKDRQWDSTIIFMPMNMGR